MKPPAHLTKQTAALWSRVLKQYALEDHHLELLRLACEALDRCTQARQAIERDGAYVKDRYGQPRAHPGIAVERDSRLAAVRIFRELDLEGEPLPAPRRRR